MGIKNLNLKLFIVVGFSLMEQLNKLNDILEKILYKKWFISR